MSRRDTLAPAAEQRLDLWLWHARVARARTQCAAIAESGAVRINRQRVEKAHARVRPGDVLTLPGPGRGEIRVIEILELTERRGSATDAARLYRVIEETGAPSGRAE